LLIEFQLKTFNCGSITKAITKMIKSVKGNFRKPIEKNIQSFIQSCITKNNNCKRSKEEIKESILSDILYHMEITRENYYLDPGYYISEGIEFQYKYTPENFDEWIEKCKKEMISGDVKWKDEIIYRNTLAYDEDFCDEVCKLHKVKL